MHFQILEEFGIHISSEEFFVEPTFEALLRLVQLGGTSPNSGELTSAIAWPLPAPLHERLSSVLETWPGQRSTASRTILTINAGGTKPPLFWVFNSFQEPVELAKALGPDQPLYAFRSGVDISDYSEDDIQAFALRYLSDVLYVCPEGPFFVGGNCQGAIIAVAIAQHALRRKRHVPLLVLMDWAFELQPYPGSVLLISGRDNFEHNSARRFHRPELAWKRAFASFEFAEIPGAYAEGFNKGPVEVLSHVLTTRMASALASFPPR